MPTAEVVDLISDDDDSSIDLVPHHDGAEAQRSVQPEETSHPVSHGAARLQDRAAIDLTGEDDAEAHMVGRPGSAGKGCSALAPTNEGRPDSRSRNQNTNAPTPSTPAGSSNQPRALVSGDADVAPKLPPVSAKAPPDALNSRSPPMFPGRIAHRPGNPYGERNWGSSAPSTRPPPLNYGLTPSQPQIISDDDNSHDDSDDDVHIDEEKSTPASATRDANPPRHSTERVRQDGSSAPRVEQEPSPFRTLSSIQRQLAQEVKNSWGVYPWEVTLLNPPRFGSNFHATLVVDFYGFVREGCPLETAKQLVEDQIRIRSAASDGSPAYLAVADIREARRIFGAQNTQRADHSREQESRAPILSQASLTYQQSSGSPLPPSLPHSHPFLPLNPSRLNRVTNSTENSTTSGHEASVPVPEQSRPAAAAGTEPHRPSPEARAQQKTGEVEDQIIIPTTPDSFQSHEPHFEAQRTVLPETTGGASINPSHNTPSEADSAESANASQQTQPAMATFVDMGSSEPSDLNADPSKGVAPFEVLTSEERQGLDDGDGYSIASLAVLLKGNLSRIHEDREYFTKFRMGRARRIHRLPDSTTVEDSANDFISGPSLVPAPFQQQAFPWPDAKPIQIRGTVKATENHKPMTQKVQDVYSHNSKGTRSTISNPVELYAVDTLPVPPYTNYLSLNQNVLAENHRTLLVYPYFDDFQDEDATKKSLWIELQSRYNIVADELRRRRLLQAEQSWQLRSYAESILKEIGCGMDDILRYFLLPSADLNRTLGEMMEPKNVAYLEGRRRASCQEEFNPEKKKWRIVLDNLPPSTTTKKLGLAAVFCPAWLDVFQFSFWHIARRASLAQPPITTSLSQLSKTNGASRFTYRKLACRVCHLHNCPFHGAILEQPEPSDHSGSEESDAAQESPDHAARTPDSSRSDSSRRWSVSSDTSLANFKKHVNARPRENPAEDEGQLAPRHLKQKTKTHIMEGRPPFIPCSHEGTCSAAKCSCFRNRIACEKTCACASSCRRRYRGCNCAQQGVVCQKNPKCDCWNLNRECDPDLCASCEAAEVLDPVNRYNDSVCRGKCGNVNIQRGVPKRTLLGQSEVQGFGLYAGENVSAGDYIGEYKGEVVAKEEGSRRGAVYQHLKTNYLFELNKEQEIDSTIAGNKLRFINNSAKAPNCQPRVLLCNAVARIGLFAIKNMVAGEELFFNYNYPDEVTQHFWEKGEPKMPAGTAYAVKTKKGGKQKEKVASAASAAANRSSDSEALATKRRGNKGKKPISQATSSASSVRMAGGETPLRAPSSISRGFDWPAKAKRPRQSVLEKRRRWEELNEVLDDEDEESFGGSEQGSDSDEDARPRKRSRKAKR